MSVGLARNSDTDRMRRASKFSKDEKKRDSNTSVRTTPSSQRWRYRWWPQWAKFTFKIAAVLAAIGAVSIVIVLLTLHFFPTKVHDLSPAAFMTALSKGTPWLVMCTGDSHAGEHICRLSLEILCFCSLHWLVAECLVRS